MTKEGSAAAPNARTKERLADAFEPRLREKKGKLNITCESEDEAAFARVRAR